jgi:putative protease
MREEYLMTEQKIGEVIKFFAKPSVAAVKIMAGELIVGDTIKFVGHNTDLTMVVDSMEVNSEKVNKAVVGDFIGIKVIERVRPADEVLKLIP